MAARTRGNVPAGDKGVGFGGEHGGEEPGGVDDVAQPDGQGRPAGRFSDGDTVAFARPIGHLGESPLESSVERGGVIGQEPDQHPVSSGGGRCDRRRALGRGELHPKRFGAAFDGDDGVVHRDVHRGDHERLGLQRAARRGEKTHRGLVPGHDHCTVLARWVVGGRVGLGCGDSGGSDYGSGDYGRRDRNDSPAGKAAAGAAGERDRVHGGAP